jgi:hypothetical protein
MHAHLGAAASIGAVRSQRCNAVRGASHGTSLLNRGQATLPPSSRVGAEPVEQQSCDQPIARIAKNSKAFFLRGESRRSCPSGAAAADTSALGSQRCNAERGASQGRRPFEEGPSDSPTALMGQCGVGWPTMLGPTDSLNCRNSKAFFLRGESRRACSRGAAAPILARGGASAAMQSEVLPLAQALRRSAKRLSHCPDGSVRSWVNNRVVNTRPTAHGVVCNLSCFESRPRRQTLQPQRCPQGQPAWPPRLFVT